MRGIELSQFVEDGMQSLVSVVRLVGIAKSNLNATLLQETTMQTLDINLQTTSVT